MPHTRQEEVYYFDELSENAKDKARDWYREGNLDYEWWDSVYEMVEQAGKYLGIDVNQNPIKLMNGKTRLAPSIWFNGFYSKSSGSAYDAVWRASDVKSKALKTDFTTDIKLHRLADKFSRIALSNPEISARVNSRRDTSITVNVELGETADERISELEYKSSEWHTQNALDGELRDALTEALNDFNHWIYQSLEKEYEWLNADEQVDESIRCNEYEFTQEGKRI